MTIRLEEIHPGDFVGLADPRNNVARGTVMRRGVMLAILAFGVAIEFARTNANGRVVPAGSVVVVEHTPALVGGAA